MDDIVATWRAAAAEPFTGWSFFHMAVREEKPPWEYPALATEALHGASSALDVDTGGGELLAAMHDAWPAFVVATEAWIPNLTVARDRLGPLGSQVVAATSESQALPFPPATFDVVLGRHAFLDATETARVLAPGGLVVTQQVGPNNHYDLRAEFDIEDPPEPGMAEWCSSLEQHGVRVEKRGEWTGTTIFEDVIALIQFLTAVPWTVTGFNIDDHLDILMRLHNQTLHGEDLTFHARRWFAVGRKAT